MDWALLQSWVGPLVGYARAERARDQQRTSGHPRHHGARLGALPGAGYGDAAQVHGHDLRSPLLIRQRDHNLHVGARVS